MLRNKTKVKLFLAERKPCALPLISQGQNLGQITSTVDHHIYGYQFASNSDH